MSGCSSCPSKGGCNKDESTCGILNNPNNNIKHVIGVMSGKGGVGKSSMATLIAKQLKAEGYSVGILDADITGPSIPRLLGINGQRAMSEDGKTIYPVLSKEGIKVMSLNLLLENEEDPVIWRGPVIANMVQSFWSDVLWGELDYLVIDMPPGTGDVALTVMQSIPLSGVVMVSMPQDLISMIVAKAVNMTKKLNIKILGVIENMSYISCPDCGKKIRLLQDAGTESFLKEMDLRLLGELPMINSICNLATNEGNNNDAEVENIFKEIVKNIKEELK